MPLLIIVNSVEFDVRYKDLKPRRIIGEPLPRGASITAAANSNQLTYSSYLLTLQDISHNAFYYIYYKSQIEKYKVNRYQLVEIFIR